MTYLSAFLLGAALGCIPVTWALLTRDRFRGHPMQAYAISAVMSGLVFGTIIWYVANRIA